MTGRPNHTIPDGWVKANTTTLSAFIHEASGVEVLESVKGWRAFKKDGTAIRGTHMTFRAAMRAAEEHLR